MTSVSYGTSYVIIGGWQYSYAVKYFGVPSDVVVLGLDGADGGTGEPLLDLEGERLVDKLGALVVGVADFDVERRRRKLAAVVLSPDRLRVEKIISH